MKNILLIASAIMTIATPTLAATGAELYQKKCAVCHTVASPETIRGPLLNGVYGRKIGSVSGYKYSKSLKGMQAKKWNTARLDDFLKNPKAFAPNTKMRPGVANDIDRIEIILYLQGMK